MTEVTREILIKNLKQLRHNYAQMDESYQDSIIKMSKAESNCAKYIERMETLTEQMEAIEKDLNAK